MPLRQIPTIDPAQNWSGEVAHERYIAAHAKMRGHAAIRGSSEAVGVGEEPSPTAVTDVITASAADPDAIERG